MKLSEQHKINRISNTGAFSGAWRIARSPRKSLQLFSSISLYRNAFYLLVNSVAVQITGFFFWMVAARLYTTEEVGLASAANNMMTLLAALAAFGLDYSIVRFLPESDKNSKDMINTCLTLQVVLSIVISGIFLAGLGFWSPALLPIRQNPLYLSIFVVSVLATTLYIFTQRIFIARLNSKLALVRGLIFAFLRFIPLVILALVMRPFGIFTAWGIAVIVAVIISMFSISRTENGYYPAPTFNKKILRDFVSYSFSNYITNIFTHTNSFIFPIMVINMLGAEQNAYFYVGWSIGSVLLIIPLSLSMSLLAEGSNDPEKLRHTVQRSLRLMILILIPAIILMLLIGSKLLLLFGGAYYIHSPHLLYWLIISALPYGINNIYFNMKRVEKQMGKVAGFSLLITVIALGLSYILLPRLGIEAVGIGWLAGQGIVALIVGYFNRRLFFYR